MSSMSYIVTEENAKMVAEWCGGMLVVQHDALDHTITSPGINVPVGEGSVERAVVGSLVIKNADGTFSVFK